DAWIDAPVHFGHGTLSGGTLSSVGTDRTDISRALRLASATFPENVHKRIVLLTDGNENQGDAAAEAQLAKARGIELWTVPYPEETTPEVLVESVSLPPRVDLDAPFEVKVVVRSTQETDGILRLSQNGTEVARSAVHLHAGPNVFFLPRITDKPGAYRYEATIEAAADTRPENNTASAVTFVAGRPRVLYLTGYNGRPGFLPSVLKAQGIDVDVGTSQDFPTTLDGLAGYRAVIFSNLPATELSDAQMKLLASYVRGLGGGFAMLGGPDSFGAGGWYGTPVEEILPVSMDLRKKKLLPTIAIAIAIDKSGSMGELTGGVEKMLLAREAAIATLDLIGPQDQIGVVCFDEAAYWTVPLQPAVKRPEIADEIATIRPGGGTDMYPALQEAYQALKGATAVVKHIIVLSDGETAPRDFDTLLSHIEADHITVSTVAVGVDADQHFMAHLAELGKGRAYYTDQPSVLPRIFTKDTILASRRAVSEKPFLPQRSDDALSLLRGVPIEQAPPLLGYVLTSPRDRAQTPLLGPDGDPLLSGWRIGLGKSIAFTCDDGRRWARPWASWQPSRTFFTQMVRWLFSDVPDASFAVDATQQGGHLRLQVDASDDSGQFQNFLDLQATVSGPSTLHLPLHQTAPGRYVAEADLPQTGSYVVTVQDPKSDRQRRVAIDYPYSPEFSQTGTNHSLMARLGRPAGPHDRFFARPPTPVYRPQDVWWPLALCALLLFPIDIAIRRVFLPDGWLRRAKGQESVAPAVDPTLSALKQRKREMVSTPIQVVAPTPEASHPEAPAPPTPGGESSLARLKRAREQRREKEP
ncbi:MAG: VWA domain-containing protein, partial [Candidatus Xenobia bacterium]